MFLNSLMADTLSPLHSLLLGGLVLVASYLITIRIATEKARQKTIKQHDCEAPPKYPSRDPFFGIDTIYDALRAVSSKTFLSQKKAHYDRYGNTFSSTLSTLPVISTIEPENIKTVLSTAFQDFVVGAPRRNAFSPILANSILISDGKQWEHSRAFLRPSFARSQVGDLSTLEAHVQNLITAIPRDGSTVDLADLFLRYTADVTTDFMFGESINSLSQPESFRGDLMRAFRDAQLGAERRFRLGSFAKFVPQPAFYQAVKKVHDYMDEHVDRAIENRHVQQRSFDEGAQDDKRHIFLHELAKLTDDRQTLRDELLGIFFAGRDTTSALLSNLFFVLARSPGIWQRLREEVDKLGGAVPTLDELKTLKYLGFCLNEGQRSCFPAGFRVNADI
jgi:cytochrome P450